jgi:hypothetical protein
MNTNDMQGIIQGLVQMAAYGDIEGDFEGEEFSELFRHHCPTFSEACIMTRNEGVVVQMRDGSEFQLTIVQSKQAD